MRRLKIAELDLAEILAGRRILIVEDEMLVAMDLQSLLEEHGCEVLGPVPSVARALEFLSVERPDAVTLDMNLNGELSSPIAAVLRKSSIPFVVVSGYGSMNGDTLDSQDAPHVGKPFSNRDLLQKIVSILA